MSGLSDGAGQTIWSGSAGDAGPLLCLALYSGKLACWCSCFLDLYGLPSAGIVLDAFTAAVIGFTLNIGAYSSRSFMPPGGHPWRQWRQPTLHRHELAPGHVAGDPAAGGAHRGATALQHLHLLVKDTSLAAAVTVPELFQAAQRLASVTYEPLILYIETALIYLMFSSVLSTLQDRLEQRLAPKRPGRSPYDPLEWHRETVCGQRVLKGVGLAMARAASPP